MRWLDLVFERSTRRLYRGTSRRHFLARVSAALFAAGAVPVLPIARGRAETKKDGIQADDETRCDYWRYCAIDGYLCSCCGGGLTTCPPGTEPSPITWIGTCHNPADGRDYIISYNDCCGKTSCGRCFCNRNEGDRPVYVPSLANDINWCLGTDAGEVYHCTLTAVLGTAD